MQNTRLAAIKMLASIEAGKTLDEASDRLQKLNTRDHAFARNMVLICLRHRGDIFAYMTHFLKKPIPPRPHFARAALQIGITQICYMKTAAHAAINETLNCLGHREKPYRGLINAVLRKLSNTLPSLPESPARNSAEWMFEIWVKTYGQDIAEKIALQHQNTPPLDLCFKDSQMAQIWAKKTHATVLTSTHLRLHDAGKIPELSGFSEGDWWIQDVAAGLPVSGLSDLNGKTILDICAAPGGKTLQFASRGAKVTSLDISGSRLSRLQENLERTELRAELVESDALKWSTQKKYDIVLLDAPCSATGTIRRHPDISLHRKPKSIERLMKLQDDLLDKASLWVRHGGELIYCSCSLDPREGERCIDSFLGRNDKFRLKSFEEIPFGALSSTGMIRTTPALLFDDGGMDGFFAARLVAL